MSIKLSRGSTFRLLQSNLKYKNRVDETVENTAKAICKLGRERLNILGIKNVELSENGPRVIQLEADGLVDIERDWAIGFSSDTKYILRLANLKEGTPNKELLESLNYEWYNRNEFGILELGRKWPEVWRSRNAVYTGDDGEDYLITEHRILIFDRNGDLIVDTVSEHEKACQKQKIGQFKTDLDLEKHLGKVRSQVVDNIIKHGIYDDNIKDIGVQLDVDEGYFSYEYGRKRVDIIVSEFEGYKIAYMGDMTDCAAGFVLFDDNDNIVTYGKDTVIKAISRTVWPDIFDEYGGSLWVFVAEDSLIVADWKNQVLVKSDMNIPKSNHIRLGVNSRESVITKENVESAIILLKKQIEYKNAMKELLKDLEF